MEWPRAAACSLSLRYRGAGISTVVRTDACFMVSVSHNAINMATAKNNALARILCPCGARWIGDSDSGGLEHGRGIQIRDRRRNLGYQSGSAAREGVGISTDRVGFISFSAGAMVTSGTLLQQDPAARPNFAAA